MASTNRSEAVNYDFALFDNNINGFVAQPKKKREIKIPVLVENEPLTAKELKLQAKESRLAAIKVFVCSFLLLAVLGSLIMGRVELTQLNNNKAIAIEHLEQSKSENTRLQMQLDSEISMEKIEEYAKKNLGMVKQESYQVSYFNINASDGAVLTQSGKTNSKTENK